jgi:hypothetical protein
MPTLFLFHRNRAREQISSFSNSRVALGISTAISPTVLVGAIAISLSPFAA